MITILLDVISFLLAILLAVMLKKARVVRQSDGQVLSKIVVWITLPATLIVGINGFSLTATVFILMGLGFLCNLLLVGGSYLISAKKSAAERSLYMLSVPGYNIGNFTIPFVTSFFPTAIPFLAMFDMGNSPMVCGGTQVLAETANMKQGSFRPIAIAKIVLKSPPFIVYLVMFILSVFRLRLPAPALVPLRFLASGNSFLSLFMIGLFLQVDFSKVKTVAKVLAARYLGAVILSLLVYFFLPLSALVREVLILVLFCPIPVMGTIQATQEGVDEGTAGFTSSLSMLVSLVFMTLVVITL